MVREMRGVNRLPGRSSPIGRGLWLLLAVMFVLTSSVSALSMAASVAAAQEDSGGHTLPSWPSAGKRYTDLH